MDVIDTHAHLNDEQLLPMLPDVLARARAAGVVNIVAIGTDLASSRECVAIAQAHDAVYATVGIQPNHVAEVAAGDWEQIVALTKNLNANKIVGLGETGLDRYWDRAPFTDQQDYFDRHLRLSQELNLPVVIHMRDCEEDVLVMLREAAARGPVRGVMHSFTGTAAGAAEAVELGLYVSFAGMVTYPKSTELREVAAGVPLERLLVETDSPYLSPHPKRGQRPNEPALVVHTAECLAQVRGVSLDEIADITTRNARAVFAVG